MISSWRLVLWVFPPQSIELSFPLAALERLVLDCTLVTDPGCRLTSLYDARSTASSPHISMFVFVQRSSAGDTGAGLHAAH